MGEDGLKGLIARLLGREVDPERVAAAQQAWNTPFVQDTVLPLAEEMGGTRPTLKFDRRKDLANVDPAKPTEISVASNVGWTPDLVRHVAPHEAWHSQNEQNAPSRIESWLRALNEFRTSMPWSEWEADEGSVAIDAVSRHHSNPNATPEAIRATADSLYNWYPTYSTVDPPDVTDEIAKVLATQFYKNHPANRNR